MANLSPDEDGITHINVYSKGATQLGRFLSNFTYAPMNTEDGWFDSVEGYWYWLGTSHPDRDELRTLSGYRAKMHGRVLQDMDNRSEPEFERKICAAITAKVMANPAMKLLMSENDLPFEHYYVYGGAAKKPQGSGWIIQHIQNISEDLKSSGGFDPNRTKTTQEEELFPSFD